MRPGRREWFTAADIVAAKVPGLSAGAVAAQAQHWRQNADRARRAPGQEGRPCWEYHVSLLPPAAQIRLAILSGGVSRETAENDEREKSIWARYEALTARQKAACERKLKALARVEQLVAGGLTESAAMAVVAREIKAASGTLWRWRGKVRGLPRADWLAALAPGYRPTSPFAACDERAWRALTSDYLRPERPGFAACYRRMKEAAAREGWSPVPSERALRRRLKAEVDAGALTIAREGRDAAKALYPAQRRSKAQLGAMGAVNMDGHKFDVFVRFADGRVGRPMLIAIQDVFSGKFLAWRHAESENRAAVRLVIGDMVETYGAPDAIYLDNGRAFASKWISGGAKTRFRFKVRDEDPQGLLVSLGVAIHWTTPYSGQSKPIERAFRDLCDDISKHPFCAGAYVGNAPDAKPENYGARAVDFDDFKAFADKQIAAHNAREGRRTPAAKGRSFDRTFAESYENAIVRWPTDAQRHLWLMAAERVKARKGSGEIHLFGNRYWSQELNAFAGQPVTVRFDPDRLHDALKVYDSAERLICEAPCVEDVGFDSADAARDHARQRTAYMKSLKEHEAIRERMTADQLAALYGDTPATSAPTPAPRAKRLATAAAPAAPAEPDIDMEEFEDAFARGLRLISGGG